MHAPTTLQKSNRVPVGARIARPRFVQNLLFAQLLIYQQREAVPRGFPFFNDSLNDSLKIYSLKIRALLSGKTTQRT